MLHAGPDAAKIDRVDPIEFFSADIGGFERRRLHAGIVERGVEAPEGRNRALDHGSHIGLVGDVAADAHGPAACAGQLVRCRYDSVFINVDQGDRRARIRKRFRRRQSHSRSGSGD